MNHKASLKLNHVTKLIDLNQSQNSFETHCGIALRILKHPSQPDFTTHPNFCWANYRRNIYTVPLLMWLLHIIYAQLSLLSFWKMGKALHSLGGTRQSQLI